MANELCSSPSLTGGGVIRMGILEASGSATPCGCREPPRFRHLPPPFCFSPPPSLRSRLLLFPLPARLDRNVPCRFGISSLLFPPAVGKKEGTPSPSRPLGKRWGYPSGGGMGHRPLPPPPPDASAAVGCTGGEGGRGM